MLHETTCLAETFRNFPFRDVSFQDFPRLSRLRRSFGGPCRGKPFLFRLRQLRLSSPALAAWFRSGGIGPGFLSAIASRFLSRARHS